MVNNIQECINAALAIDGTLGVALGDWRIGFALGQASLDTNRCSLKMLEQSIEFNSEIIKVEDKLRRELEITSPIEDMFITLRDQYHLIRICQKVEDVFFYLVMNRDEANMGLSLIKLNRVEQMLRL